MKITKNYKPEILECPKCNGKLQYSHSVSAKTIYFSGGKCFFVRNLGYKCPFCNDHIYFSQTATKFTLKGYRYSLKIVFMIYNYKMQGYSREKISIDFEEKGVTVSERNVDILYNHFLELLTTNYDEKIKEDYEAMINEFGEIRLSIDLISHNKNRLVVIRNYFTAEIIGFSIFKSDDSESIREFLSRYLDKSLPIGVIATIRKEDFFTPIMKQLVPCRTKFITYLKV